MLSLMILAASVFEISSVKTNSGENYPRDCRGRG